MDYKELCPIGTNVRIIAPIDSEHKNWTVMPVVRDKSQMFIPKGYKLIEGVGNVTGYELKGLGKDLIPESNHLQYDNLIVVQHIIQCRFVKEWWRKELAHE